jgi:mannose-6-phosphate isomerase-like protein (cupin superfamily)
MLLPKHYIRLLDNEYEVLSPYFTHIEMYHQKVNYSSLIPKEVSSMLVKDIRECSYFTAKDGSILCELLHPLREDGKVNLRCSIAHARIPAGKSTLPHKLQESAEVYYILEGEGVLHVDRESTEVKPGRAVYVPPGAVQHLENTGDGELSFLCIVDPMWTAEQDRETEIY